MEEEQATRKRSTGLGSTVLRVLGIGGGAGFIFVTLLVVLAIIWAVEP